MGSRGRGGRAGNQQQQQKSSPRGAQGYGSGAGLGGGRYSQQQQPADEYSSSYGNYPSAGSLGNGPDNNYNSSSSHYSNGGSSNRFPYGAGYEQDYGSSQNYGNSNNKYGSSRLMGESQMMNSSNHGNHHISDSNRGGYGGMPLGYGGAGGPDSQLYSSSGSYGNQYESPSEAPSSRYGYPPFSGRGAAGGMGDYNGQRSAGGPMRGPSRPNRMAAADSAYGSYPY